MRQRGAEFEARWGEALRAAERWRETALYAELERIGAAAGQEGLLEGCSFGEAIWRAMPHHAEFGGLVWRTIERGVRRVYGAEAPE